MIEIKLSISENNCIYEDFEIYFFINLFLLWPFNAGASVQNLEPIKNIGI